VKGEELVVTQKGEKNPEVQGHDDSLADPKGNWDTNDIYTVENLPVG
jgi:hypothetical protein